MSDKVDASDSKHQDGHVAPGKLNADLTTDPRASLAEDASIRNEIQTKKLASSTAVLPGMTLDMSSKESVSISEQVAAPETRVKMQPEALPVTGTPEDSKLQARDLASEKKAERSADVAEADLKKAHDHLHELVQKLPFEKQFAFIDDMQKFEERASKDHLSPDEIKRTYEAISKLIEHDGEKPLAQKDRLRVAAEVMGRAAQPTHIDQGNHFSCEAATLESRTYTKYPAEAAEMVAEVATTSPSQYHAKDGTVVHVPEGSIQPHSHDDSVDYNDERLPEGYRGLAGQIFQVTAVNVHYAKVDPEGKMHYEQQDPNPSAKPYDSGERLYGKDGKEVMEDGQPARYPMLQDDHTVEISNAITGARESGQDIVMVSDKLVSGEGKLVNKIDSNGKFDSELARLKTQGKLPIIIVIDDRNEPFRSEHGAGGAGGKHVATITDYDPGPNPPATAKVAVDNQWGSQRDNSGLPGEQSTVPVPEMFAAMQPFEDHNSKKNIQIADGNDKSTSQEDKTN